MRVAAVGWASSAVNFFRIDRFLVGARPVRDGLLNEFAFAGRPIPTLGGLDVVDRPAQASARCSRIIVGLPHPRRTPFVLSKA